MKNISSNLLFIFALILTSLSMQSCSESHADSPAENSSITENKIPALLSRPDKLTPTAEWTEIAKRYDQAVATLTQNPQNGEARVKLATLFINEARVTGEHPYYYPAALAMLDAVSDEERKKSEEVDFAVRYLKASVQLSLHDFKTALETGLDAVEKFPMNAGLYGVLVDAYTELGDYQNAVKMSDKMVSMRPDLRSYSRISYLRELHGEVEGSIEAMKMAVGAGLRGSEQQAWCRLQLGQLHERYGDLDQAEMQYKIILEERPNYPFAVAALGEIELKKGNKEAAATYFEEAIALIPEVGFYEQKASLLQSEGKDAEAKKIGKEIIEMMNEDQAAGHNMDLEMAAVHLDLLDQPQVALELALKALEARPENIDVHKMLARVYYEQNEMEKAAKHLEKARITNSKDPMLLCLAGLIKLETGMQEEGKALIAASFTSDPFQSHSLVARASAHM